MNIQSLFYVFIGGGMGSVLRFMLSKTGARYMPFFPLGTLIANLLGSFLIGLLTVWFIDKNLVPSPYREMVLTGFLGGLTTFSTFSLETFYLLDSARYSALLAYTSLNLAGGLVLVFIGRYSGNL